jgi:hypothetical protein
LKPHLSITIPKQPGTSFSFIAKPPIDL